MRTYVHILGIVAVATSASFGLEFGVMGNVSAGMGAGRGRAQKLSLCSLLYIPRF